MAESRPAASELAAFLGRYGLHDLSTTEIAEFAAMAERVEAQAASVSRMSEKTDEPAHVFRVAARP